MAKEFGIVRGDDEGWARRSGEGRQPPAAPGVRCELQARVVLPVPGEPLEGRGVAGLPPSAAGRVVSARGCDHVFLLNLTGGQPGDGLGYAEQTAAMFRLAQTALEREHLSFRDVIRTWIYVDRMEQDYAALNQERGAFFAEAGVTRLPASLTRRSLISADHAGLLRTSKRSWTAVATLLTF